MEKDYLYFIWNEEEPINTNMWGKIEVDRILFHHNHHGSDSVIPQSSIVQYYYSFFCCGIKPVIYCILGILLARSFEDEMQPIKEYFLYIHLIHQGRGWKSHVGLIRVFKWPMKWCFLRSQYDNTHERVVFAYLGSLGA